MVITYKIDDANCCIYSNMVLNLDLNCPPHDEDSSMNINTTLELGLPCAQMRTSYEPDDDDVIICSPRSFADAVNNSRRNRRVIEVVDDETESQRGSSVRQSGNCNKRPRISAKQRGGVVNSSVYLEDQDLVELSQPVPQPKPPTFSCPVCMEPIVEVTSTKCGHVFCKKCIVAAIEIQHKCPTCRRKLKKKDVIRIYLPNAQ
ncbi:E3 ubiquitin- ligase RNF4-like [Olea europaea subsp. europaea]|uniref:E3 ubiquitin- ligase RNF4-like n=1 Tax=Olea europaea subsp. europaea TaxID=158383 RepID=A0A8S0PV32_OLEEU|nr:E3 ubiquitin- ligase RNF4-like [Olea europaea subsp. europaea]